MTKSTFVSRRDLLAAMSMTALPIGLGMGLPARAAGTALPPLSAFGKLPVMQDVAISPDGKRVAFIMSKNGERLIYDYDLTTKKAAAAAIAGDKLRDLMWADNSHVIVVTSKTQNDVGQVFEQWYGLMLDIPNGKRIQMYSNTPGVNQSDVSGSFYRLKIDGQYRITAGGWQAPDALNMVNSDGANASITDTVNRCLFAFDPATGRGRRLDNDPQIIQDWALRADTGKIIGRSEYDDDTKTWTLRMRGDKGWSTIYSFKAPYDMPGLAGLGRDGASLLIRMNGGEDAGRYFEVDAKGNKTLLDLPNENYSPLFDRATNALVGFANDGSIETYVFYDPVLKKLPALVNEALPDSKNRLLDFGEDPRKFIIHSEGSGDAGTFYAFDFTVGASTELGSSYPELTGAVAEKRYVSYPAADGLEIHGWLTLPTGEAKNRALVVLPHGGPEAFDDAGFDWISQAIASRGYVVLQPNYRGSAGYGKDFTTRGYGEYGRKMQTDLSDGVRYLVKEGMVDPKRVAVAGASYGGYAALAGVSLDPGVYNCAVAISGLSDLKTFMAYVRERSNFDSKSYSMQYWQRYMGDMARLDDISPIRHIGNITVPVMLIHGKDDTVVPYDQSAGIYDALNKAGKPVEFVQLKQEDHWLSREPTRIQTLEAMVGFLVKNNPPA